jgi:hypothetical protein
MATKVITLNYKELSASADSPSVIAKEPVGFSSESGYTATPATYASGKDLSFTVTSLPALVNAVIAPASGYASDWTGTGKNFENTQVEIPGTVSKIPNFTLQYYDDSVSFYEVLSITVSFQRVLLDPVAFEEYLNKSVNKAFADTYSVSDSSSREANKTINDSVSFSEVVRRDYNKGILEPVSMVEYLSFALDVKSWAPQVVAITDEGLITTQDYWFDFASQGGSPYVAKALSTF